MRKPKSDIEVELDAQKKRDQKKEICYPLVYIETTVSRDVCGLVG